MKRTHIKWTAAGVALFGGIALLVAAAVPDRASRVSDAAPVRAAGTNHPMIIHRPDGPPLVLTTRTNYSGATALVSCSSCHATTTPNRNIRSGEQLQKFHQGLVFDHGSQSCLNCHNESNYDSLRLANGDALPYPDVMTLCGQCHGPQLRDYERGLHGGMNGYWDLSRGPRVRNNCIQCHDPHAPAYPMVKPVLPPKDRITVPKAHSHGSTDPGRKSPDTHSHLKQQGSERLAQLENI